jgi:hypothetical protein
VAGRLQGDPGSIRRPALRLRVVAAALVVAGLVASAVIGAAEVLPRVQEGIDRDSRLTTVDRRHAAGDRLRLDPAPFDAFRAGLEPRDRYSVDVPAGSKGPFITRGEVVRAYAAFFFLPAIQVPAAERVFHYRFR